MSDKPGTHWISERPSSDKGSPQSDPLEGKSGTSTHTKFSKETVKGNKGGKVIEGQSLRGYVFNDAGKRIGEVKDATVAPDGTNRVKTSG